MELRVLKCWRGSLYHYEGDMCQGLRELRPTGGSCAESACEDHEAESSREQWQTEGGGCDIPWKLNPELHEGGERITQGKEHQRIRSY